MNTSDHRAHWGTGNYQNLKTGWLCLDFANTADWHASDAPEEQIVSYDELVNWALEKAILDETAVENLRALARRSTKKAQQAHQEAIELREVLYRIFSTIAANHDPAEADLDRLNHYLSRALPHLRLQISAEGYQWGWRDKPELVRVPSANIQVPDPRGAMRR
jgi:predicted RNA-binding Zn ribbon-like protein